MLAGWIREPLLHFAVLGALLFGFSAWLEGGEPRDGRQIVVTPERVAQLVELWQRTWQRAPTEAEIEGIVEAYLQEEVLVREALALGLDRDDTIVRRRLRQKMEFLADELFEEPAPTDAQLVAHLEAHPERFRLDPRLSLRQLYVSRDRWRDEAEARALALLRAVQKKDAPAAASLAGDPLPLPRSLQDAPRAEVARLFGDDFADTLLDLEPGRWHGPVGSGYGLHVVWLEAVEPARDPALAEVRAAVERDWRAQQGDEARRRLHARLRAGYDIRVEVPGLEALEAELQGSDACGSKGASCADDLVGTETSARRP